MGTRSLIILEDGKSIKGIYCGSDGYPNYLGLVLRLGYHNPERARKLINIGAIGSIRYGLKNVELTHRGWDKDDKFAQIIEFPQDAKPSHPDKLNPFLAQMIIDNSAEYVYWGQVLETKEGGVVAWSCLNTVEKKFENLYNIDPTNCVGEVYCVYQEDGEWQYGIFSQGESKKVKCVGFTEEDCYEAISGIEYAPERDCENKKNNNK